MGWNVNLLHLVLDSVEGWCGEVDKNKILRCVIFLGVLCVTSCYLETNILKTELIFPYWSLEMNLYLDESEDCSGRISKDYVRLAGC
jgi:hypothetical protein